MFWHSLESRDSKTYKSMNDYLFKENIDLVKEWMLWKHTSQDKSCVRIIEWIR